MISIQFASGDTQGKTDVLVKEFNKNRPLFQLIANSFIIMDKYK
jgi:hypothetical protein